MIKLDNVENSEDWCVEVLQAIRWSNGTSCPYCSSTKVTEKKYPIRNHCNTCNTPFSVKTQTIFHKSRIPFTIWFKAIDMLLNSRRIPSIRELGRRLNINKNTAARIKDRVSYHVYIQDGMLFQIAKTISKNG